MVWEKKEKHQNKVSIIVVCGCGTWMVSVSYIYICVRGWKYFRHMTRHRVRTDVRTLPTSFTKRWHTFHRNGVRTKDRISGSDGIWFIDGDGMWHHMSHNCTTHLPKCAPFLDASNDCTQWRKTTVCVDDGRWMIHQFGTKQWKATSRYDTQQRWKWMIWWIDSRAHTYIYISLGRVHNTDRTVIDAILRMIRWELNVTWREPIRVCPHGFMYVSDALYVTETRFCWYAIEPRNDPY